MSTNSRTRRLFLQASATIAVGTSAATLTSGFQSSNEAGAFSSAWQTSPDRVWMGADYWANPLQDWRLAAGRIECLNAAPNRNVHLLTRQLIEAAGDLQMSVKLGPLVAGNLASGGGSAGFRIGILGPLKDYRNSLIFGQGLDAGVSSDGRTSDGKLFIGAPATGVALSLDVPQLELRLAVESHREQAAIILSAHAADGKELARVRREGLSHASLAGNLALVANFGTAGGGGGNQKGKKAKAKGVVSDAVLGQFWFADWKLRGSKLQAQDDQVFGPILFNQYTLHGGTLKMTAQMPPLGRDDSQTLLLEVERDGRWTPIGEATIHAQARTATFRVDKWDTARDVPYRLTYSLRRTDGTSTPHEWQGTIRRDPTDQPVLTVADVSCNIHEAFPNTLYTANMAKLNPDFLAFVGDQFYESSGGYGVQRAPLEPAILDYLRKWYMHGWTWRDLTRDRPSISIPDDHDVYQGNNWGESGAPQTGTQEQGGYNMPAPWVNVVHHTQTSHHPDPWDATPCKQGISVYSGPLVYGRVSFAILADRQFKSAPEGKVPPTGGRGDHVTDPSFDPKTADLPGLQLLGPMQMQHLKKWVADWKGADMKAVISQTVFTAMATTHGAPNARLVADYDTNGWPQSERNDALREIRKALAFHIAGDQHLPALIHYGIDVHNDAGIAFAGPAMNTGYARWFEPEKPGVNRAPELPENTGEYRDSFGNPMTVRAFANPAKQPRQPVLEKLHDKVSGLGLVRFDKRSGMVTVECWPLLADITQRDAQFPGWPQSVPSLANYARKPTAFLPRIQVRGVENPLIEVFEQATGELVYALRLRMVSDSPSWQPHVFATGNYSVHMSDPDTGKSKTLTGLAASTSNQQTLEVNL